MKNLSLSLALTCLIAFQISALDYNILDYGAEKDKLSTAAIQKAVDLCTSNGGGKVIVPTGTFITGSIILKSNVNLYLENGAILLGSTDIQDYKVSGVKRGIIFAEDAINLGVSGLGTIDANGDSFYDLTKNHTYEEFNKNKTRQKERYMAEGTFFTDGPAKRTIDIAMTLVFFHCNKVFINGITIKNTPLWATRFGYCDGVLIDGVNIQNNLLIPNSDGIHCTTSRNILISNCNIVAGDDAIVLTGFTRDEETPGFNSTEQDKHKYGNKTIYGENMTVINCLLKSRSSGIRIGYGQHPIRRCTFSNIVIYDSHRGIGIFAHDASDIEELVFSNITIETRLHNGQWWGHGEPIHLSCISRFEGKLAGQIKNVQFNNIVSTGEQGILVFGQKESPMENIEFNNVQLRMRKGKETMGYGGNFDLRPATPKDMQIFEHDISGIYAQYVNNLSIRGFSLKWNNDLPTFFTHGIECVEVKDLLINDFFGTSNPNSVGSKKIQIQNSSYRK
ncbi:MAG: hypothetical protein EAZ07_01735 [Cytophagales bacterium]|nr:MAG: hypothetical protein EAZ07_01735 [Cytophagales bacterium]